MNMIGDKKIAIAVGISSAVLIHKILIKKEGPVHVLKDYIAYYYLKRLKKKSKHRLESLYDIFSNDPFKFGILVPPTERYFDFPRNDLTTEADDNLMIFGVNSKNEKLLVRISRTSTNHANVWVYLRLSDGKCYVHSASDEYIKIPKMGDDTFAAGGLRLRCLSAMRKWRVSFNGMLRDCGNTSTNAQYVHIKFSFIWVTSSTVVDFSEDIPESVLSKYFASETWQGWLPEPNSVKECLDSFDQAGMLLGTVSVNNEEEQELYLWGGRKRSIERAEKVESSVDFFGSLKDGDYFHICRLTLQNSKSSLDYGCIMMPTGFVHVMDDLEITLPDAQDKDGRFNLNSASINFRRDKILYTIKIDVPNEFHKFGKADIQFAQLTMNDDVGQAMVIYTSRTSCWLSRPQLEPEPLKTLVSPKSELVAQITELTSKDVGLVGGKGASLGQLSHLSKEDNSAPFTVPRGIVVTTKAYQKFLSIIDFEEQILDLENAAWKHVGDLKECCERAIKSLSSQDLPNDIISALEDELKEIFGHSLENTKFAVRSSALGEDSEDMSAAGQMETFLGVSGLSEIGKAIVKCWASQFSYIAIQYKRQNGQLLNIPMAVVVQEMVNADTAGVIFTCDPVTGNPQMLTITANYGLGESVVSASAEPDTICLECNVHNEFKFRSVEIGKKGTKILLSETNGTKETKTTDQESNQCCIDSDSALKLASVALQVEKHFACPMDIEWAIKQNNVYLLQARPVTTYDRETDFEIKHAVDTALYCEDDYTSTANVGEVFLGAASPSGISTIVNFIVLNVYKKWAERNIILIKFNPYLWKGFIVSQSHLLFGVFDSVLKFHKKGGSVFGDSQMISLFGRVVTDDDMIDGALRRSKKDTAKYVSYRIVFYLLYDLISAEKQLQEGTISIQKENISFESRSNSQQMFHQTMHKLFTVQKFMTAHGVCTFASSIFNVIVLYILRSAKGEWHEDVYNDFASLVSNCPKVESVDVPHALQKLATAISETINPTIFKSMETREALRWLQTTDTIAGKMFADFIEKHGHRCVNELDIYAKPWNYDPTPVVNSLKEMVGTAETEQRKAKELSITELINNLKVQLNWKNRLIFRLVLPYCQRAVGQRERSKSVLVKSNDVIRRAFRSIDAKMVEEGRLPERDLIYFLNYAEIEDLLRTRSPRLVQCALRRKNMHTELSELRFPEIIKGIPRPINIKNRDQSKVESSLIMKGTPVSLGVARGFARVATSLKEAAHIQPGEILIAYGTDIGWSPYFPMLAGVATELGGLISHGAVVAREYGLPCVVGLHGATLQFQTGDFVLLDGSRGILKRIDKEQEPNGSTTNL